VRGFLREQLSPDISDKVLNGYELAGRTTCCGSGVCMSAAGAAMGWPVEFGGPVGIRLQQYIFEEESALPAVRA